MSLPPDAARAYLTGDPAESTGRALKHELVSEVRRVVEAVALIDLRGTEDEALTALIGSVRQVADEVGKLPELASSGGLAAARWEDAALMERSGISGRSNPLAPPLHLRFEGDGVAGDASYGAPYEGPVGCLHGGFVAAAFDDLLGFAQLASGQAGYTGTLTVRMRRPTPLYRRIDYVAGLERVMGRKVVCWGRSFDGDVLLAEAEIVFIAPRHGTIPEVAAADGTPGADGPPGDVG